MTYSEPAEKEKIMCTIISIHKLLDIKRSDFLYNLRSKMSSFPPILTNSHTKYCLLFYNYSKHLNKLKIEVKLVQNSNSEKELSFSMAVLLLRPNLVKFSTEALMLQSLRASPNVFLSKQQNIKNVICCSLTKKPKSIFTQADLDKVHKKRVNAIEKDIKDKVSEDMFGSVKTIGKAFLLAFIGATLTQIAYGRHI